MDGSKLAILEKTGDADVLELIACVREQAELIKALEAASVTPAQAVAILNRLVAADVGAMSALVNHRVPANAALRADPTAQCGGPTLTIGMLGVINAIFGVDATNWGHIAVQVGDAGDVEYFIERRAP
jgi:hypothetical protein